MPELENAPREHIFCAAGTVRVESPAPAAFTCVSAGASVRADLSSASTAAWWTLTACGAVVLLLGLVATTGRATVSARRTAAELNPEALAA